MSQINDEFMEAYKRIDKFCKEAFGTEKGVTSYIDEMREKTDGAKYVSGWKESLAHLVEYRDIRNRHSHEVGSSYSDICEMNDVYWLRRFYEKLISVQDPLSIYNNAKKQTQNKQPVKTKISNLNTEDAIKQNDVSKDYKETKSKSTFRVILILIILIALTVLAIDIALMIL